MIILRYLLFPFALLYGCIAAIRNIMYDKGWLTSYTFEVPTLVVGNLSVGGTGKTPQIESLIRLLQPQYRLATLSRGYGRKSKGYVVANDLESSEVNGSVMGDEPFQMHLKFPEITVAVDADRRHGILQLLARNPKPEVILLDDAFQHRRVKAGFYILLTAYDDLFCKDWMLPTGTLREFTSGKKRAHVVIVTKCPADLTEQVQHKIRKQLNVNIPVYFSAISYDSHVYNTTEQRSVGELRSMNKLLLTGIAKPEPFYAFLKQEGDAVLTFPDHHEFSDQDIVRIDSIANGRPIITTEKDFVRLLGKGIQSPLYYLPITSKLIQDEALFFQQIQNFINSSLPTFEES